MNTDLFSKNISTIKNSLTTLTTLEKVENYFMSYKDVIRQTPQLTPIKNGLLCELHNRTKSLEILFSENEVSYLKIDNNFDIENKGVVFTKEDFLKLISWYFS